MFVGIAIVIISELFVFCGCNLLESRSLDKHLRERLNSEGKIESDVPTKAFKTSTNIMRFR